MHTASKVPTVLITSDMANSSGALRSPVDPDDHIYERVAKGPEGFYMAALPEEFDLRRVSKPSRDQGTRGTCAAFTAANIKEIQEVRDVGFDERMSPEFIYHHRENKPSVGMYGRNVFQILQRIGSVPEAFYAYQRDENSSMQPDDILYRVAKKYRISNYARVTTIDGLKRALLELGPCYLQLPLYNNRPEFWKPENDSDKGNGGHAVTVVGYNRKGFILQNSWGPTWNGDGYIVMNYDDWPCMWECWTSVDEKSADIPATPTSSKKKKKTCYWW